VIWKPNFTTVGIEPNNNVTQWPSSKIVVGMDQTLGTPVFFSSGTLFIIISSRSSLSKISML
jgi:hypothetical protein